MRSEGFSFYIWGPGGGGVFVGRRFGVRNRSQTLATACNCPQPLATACNCLQPSSSDRLGISCRAYMCSSAREVIFRVFQRCVVAFHVAIMALRDMWTCFVTCRESFCVAGPILLRRCHKMRCIFRGRRSTLDVSSFILRGRRSTSDVSCCLFSANRIVRADR